MPFFSEIPLYTIDTLPVDIDKKSDVIVAVGAKHTSEILDTLLANGFSNIYTISDWNKANADLRRLWCEACFEFYGFEHRKGSDCNGYVQYNFNGKEYKFYFPVENAVYFGSIAGEFSDIVMPSLLGNYNHVFEGPYELDNVSVKKSDIVFDLGAHVGLFTGVAAVKGAHVYAFEPTPETLGYLKKSVSFYDNVTVCPYAVSDSTGPSEFYINTDFNERSSLGSNSLFDGTINTIGDHFDTIEINTVTLDEFVESNGIQRVDFIKADIEGAERNMLIGAQRTLARFAPKLALCTYHLSDDPEVMEKLILAANPKYIITHSYSKLYAYCPKLGS